MTEREWMEKIRVSAEGIEIPESISPDKVRRRLKKQKVRYIRKQAIAEAIIIICGAGAFAGYRNAYKSVNDAEATDEMFQIADSAAIENMDNTGIEQAAENMTEPVDRRDAGTMYIVAKNYGEVYDMLAENDSRLMYGMEDYEIKEFHPGESSVTSISGRGPSTAMSDSIVQNSMASLAESKEESSYSRTNVQTEGVDESDIIQTDGSYIYVVNDRIVQIIDINSDSMYIKGQIDAPMDSASDRIVELYVNGDCLNLIVEHEKTVLNQSDEDVYYMDTDRTTELLTYDISNRANPKLSGSVNQDGYYKTSRKIGSMVYLLTQEMLEMPAVERETAIFEDGVSKWIPLVNGNTIAADCIYLPANRNSGRGLIISSINVDQPDQVVDSTMILNNYVEVYVSTEALYLYGTGYSNGGVHTEIAKFGLNDGIINAVGATSAAGEVYDTFAINEEQGKLRLLTTDWSQGKDENNLYLFDEELSLTGSLTGIAEGERIYAARYFGNMAYFVTYRNTDPLFAVDLSDETDPKILSELEITGFSEYLHFWGNNRLVGIGYETDPDTGRQEGIKLTMFDLSDPAELKTLGTCVIENIDYCPAFYNYKYVLADAGENLLGFAAETYGSNREDSYLLFSWEGGSFQKLLVETLSNNAEIEGYRGIYAGDTFYLVNEDRVVSYDRTQDYQKKGELEL